MSALRTLAVFAVVSNPQGCGPEYGLTKIPDTAVLVDAACDEGADAAALPEERPVAVCDVSRTQLMPIHEFVNFDGTRSHDPSGGQITTWDWKLVEAPEGSAAVMPSGNAVRAGFFPDVAGQYTARLVVVNDQCVASEPCLVTVDARPSQDLWVELFWEHAGDDMDLHLLQQGAGYTSGGDCYYGNCVGVGLDWGVQGEWIDDPFLDLDDIPNTGPENINIASPASGGYEVVVHDYPGSVHTGANDVTVRVYAGGELAFEQTRTISGEDRYVPFAHVEWPSGVVTSL